MDDLNDPIELLLKRAGVDNAETDENGVYSLFVDESLPVFLKRSADRLELYFYAGIASLDDPQLASVARIMLEGNRVSLEQDGFALGVGPDTDLVFLMAHLRLSGYADDELFEMFDRFVEAADAWRERLADGAEQSRTASGDECDLAQLDGRATRPSDLV